MAQALAERRFIQFQNLKRTLPYILIFISAALFLTVGGFFLERIAFFKQNWWEAMNSAEFFMSLLAFCGSFALFLFFAHYYFHVKPRWVLLFGVLIVCILNAMAVFFVPSSIQYNLMGGGTVTVEYVLSAKIRDILWYGVAGVMFYVLLGMIQQVIRNVRSLTIYFYAAIVVAIIAIIFSIIKDTDVYIAYFDGTPEKVPESSLESFFTNSNTFVTALIFAMMAVGYLHCQKAHFWNYILMHIFYFWLLLSYSQTAAIIGTFYLVVFILYRFIHCLNEHLLYHILGVIIYAAFAAAFFGIARSGIVPANTPYFKYVDHIFSSFLKAIAESKDFNHRTQIWATISGNIGDPFHAIFGYGEGYALKAFSFMVTGHDGIYSAHNAYVHLLFSGGVLRLSLYVIFMAYLIYLCIDCISAKQATIGAICILNIFVYLIHGIPETTGFFVPDAKGIIGLILCALPLSVEHYQRNHPKIHRYQMFLFEIHPPRIRYGLNPTYHAIWGMFYSVLFLVFPTAFFLLMSSSGNPFFLRLSAPLAVITPLVSCLVLVVYLYFAAHLNTTSRHLGYVFFGLGLFLILFIQICLGAGFIDGHAAFFMSLAIWIVYVALSLGNAILGRIYMRFKLIAYFSLFAAFSAAVLLGTNVRFALQFDPNYFAVAYLIFFGFLFLLMYMILLSRAKVMGQLRVKMCIFELKAHRFFMYVYSRQEAADEAYATGMKLIRHGRYDYTIE